MCVCVCPFALGISAPPPLPQGAGDGTKHCRRAQAYLWMSLCTIPEGMGLGLPTIEHLGTDKMAPRGRGLPKEG